MQQTTSQEIQNGAALRRLASTMSVITAIALVALKLLAYFATGSVALLTSAVDALVDTGASFVTYLGIRYAARPPDHDHRFGHSKGEAVAAFTQAMFLAGAALVLAVQSLQRLVFPQHLAAINVGILVITASLVAALSLVVVQSWVLRKTNSTAIAADRVHYLTDVAVNLAVLAALGITKATGWTRVDPIFALLIAGYMLWNARAIARAALVQLLDQELPESARAGIKAAVLACAGASGVHDLRTRSSGDRVFIEYHLEVDGRLSVERGHAIGDATESAIRALLPGTVEVTAHLEPYGIDDEKLDNLIQQ